MMKLHGIALAALVAFALSCSGGPQIAVDSEVRDLGDLVPRERKTVWFKLSNDGDAELVIENIRPLCDCIVIGNAPEKIAEKSADSIEVAYTAPDSTGPDESYLMVRTNAEPRNLKLGIHANVIGIKLTAADSSIVVMPFQVHGLADGQKFSLDIFQHVVQNLPERFPPKSPNEITIKIRDDPSFEKEPLHDVVRKWANVLGVRYVVIGDARPSARGEGLDLSIMLVDGMFRLPMGKRISGVPRSAAFDVTSDTLNFMLANISSLSREAFMTDLQRKWAEQRAAMIGKPAPPLSAEDIRTGKLVSVSDFKGKPLIVQFFSQDCDHCEEEMNWLTGLVTRHPEIAALGVSVDVGELDEVRALIDEKKPNYPIILPSEENEKQLDPYYGGATPQTVIISPEGIVVEYFMGFSRQTLDRFEQILIGMIE